MKFIELAKKRFSSRSYTDQTVEPEKIASLLEAARVAPSAVNYQPWHFIVIQRKANIEKVAECYKRDWLKKAPVLIVACGDHSRSWKRSDSKDFCDVDISIAVDHITLAATEIGLGTCWVCNFNVDECSNALNLPPHLEPIVLIPVGYPADVKNDNRHSFERKHITDIVSWETYQINS